MKGQNIPREHHVVRLVTYSRLDIDPEGNPRGILFSAFQLKPSEEGLSVTWMEYFPGDRNEKIARTVRAIRASNLKPGRKSGYAIGKVETIAAACASRSKIRVIHWPEEDNKAHAEIRQMPRDDREVLDRLASQAWCELVLNASIPEGEEAASDEPAVPIAK
jgi:hypothetical protein